MTCTITTQTTASKMTVDYFFFNTSLKPCQHFKDIPVFPTGPSDPLGPYFKVKCINLVHFESSCMFTLMYTTNQNIFKAVMVV